MLRTRRLPSLVQVHTYTHTHMHTHTHTHTHMQIGYRTRSPLTARLHPLRSQADHGADGTDHGAGAKPP